MVRKKIEISFLMPEVDEDGDENEIYEYQLQRIEDTIKEVVQGATEIVAGVCQGS